MDVLIVIFLLPIILILISILSIILFIFNGLPIFYVSKRIGKNYRIFKMYKFRTMKVNSIDLRNKDGSTFNSKKDPRLTYIGKIFRKLSIDEIPQLINVLKGEMSIVGPRPDLPDQVKIYDTLNISKKRFLMKPGITGYAQVIARNSATIIDRTLLDDYYYHHVSFMLDIKIILLTIFNVLSAKNIHKND